MFAAAGAAAGANEPNLLMNHPKKVQSLNKQDPKDSKLLKQVQMMMYHFVH